MHRTLYIEGLHPTATGHVVAPRSLVPGMRSKNSQETLWIGREGTVQGPIVHAGAVVLSQDVAVWAGIEGGHEVTVGARCRVQGPIRAEGRIVVQSGSRVDGPLHAGGDVLLLGDCRVGDVRAGGDIIVVGEPRTGALAPGGRVATRPW